MGLVDYISREPQQEAVNIPTYDEQILIAKLDALKCNAKRSLLNSKIYTKKFIQKKLCGM